MYFVVPSRSWTGSAMHRIGPPPRSTFLVDPLSEMSSQPGGSVRPAIFLPSAANLSEMIEAHSVSLCASRAHTRRCWSRPIPRNPTLHGPLEALPPDDVSLAAEDDGAGIGLGSTSKARKRWPLRKRSVDDKQLQFCDNVPRPPGVRSSCHAGVRACGKDYIADRALEFVLCPRVLTFIALDEKSDLVPGGRHNMSTRVFARLRHCMMTTRLRCEQRKLDMAQRKLRGLSPDRFSSLRHVPAGNYAKPIPCDARPKALKQTSRGHLVPHGTQLSAAGGF